MMNRRLLLGLLAGAPAAVATSCEPPAVNKMAQLSGVPVSMLTEHEGSMLNADQWNWHWQQAVGGEVQPAPEEYLPEGFERFGLMSREEYLAMRRSA